MTTYPHTCPLARAHIPQPSQKAPLLSNMPVLVSLMFRSRTCSEMNIKKLAVADPDEAF